MVSRAPAWLVIVASLTACVGGADGDDDDEDRDSGGDSGLVVQGDGRLFINEFMASNRSLAIDPDDPEATSDWVEIFNASSFDVDLTGFTITDELEQPDKARLGSLVVPAGGHLVLLADGGDGGIHLPFKLDADGDDLGLYAPDGAPLDQLTFGGQIADVTAGRAPDGGALGFLPEPTPGDSNPTEFRP